MVPLESAHAIASVEIRPIDGTLKNVLQRVTGRPGYLHEKYMVANEQGSRDRRRTWMQVIRGERGYSISSVTARTRSCSVKKRSKPGGEKCQYGRYVPDDYNEKCRSADVDSS